MPLMPAAAGILIWDNRPTTGHLRMSSVEEGGISSVFVWQEYGAQIKAQIDAGKTVKVDTEIKNGLVYRRSRCAAVLIYELGTDTGALFQT